MNTIIVLGFCFLIGHIIGFTWLTLQRRKRAIMNKIHINQFLLEHKVQETLDRNCLT